jgi:predicted ATP-grasp superfamily ATP-dependent carboligase
MASEIRQGAIITGGDHQGLGALRNLARHHIPCIILDHDYCIARFSRYPCTCYRSPHPSEHQAYVDFLIQLAHRANCRNWVIFPNCDEIVYILSKNKSLLEEYYKIPTPGWDIIKNVYDKKNTYQLAAQHHIPIPKTYFSQNLEELLSMLLEYPVVLKPAIRDHFYNKIKIKAFRADNKKQLQAHYQLLTAHIPPDEVLVQELIPGGPKQLYSFCPFFKNGQAHFSITARRIRQHPMDFGHATTFAEKVDVPDLQAISEKFLSLIHYYGLAEVEFMLDPRDQQFKLIEINPRIWGWHTLAIACGIDLPYIQFLDITDQTIPTPASPPPMKWVRLVTDIPTVCRELSSGRLKWSDYLQTMKGKKEFSVFSFNDPLPFIAEIALIPYLWKKRGF